MSPIYEVLQPYQILILKKIDQNFPSLPWNDVRVFGKNKE